MHKQPYTYETATLLLEEISSKKPFSIALIDLDIGSSNQLEGFELCEYLLQDSPIKTIIYTGKNFDDFSMEMLNSGIAYGYLRKDSDIFEDLISIINKFNRYFYSNELKLTNFSSIEGIYDFNQLTKSLDVVKNSKGEFVYFINKSKNNR